LALDGVGLTVAEGEFVAVVGPSGCGKSTLLRILGGLLVPTEGRVRLDGRLPASQPRQVGYVFQKVSLMPWRTVLRNVTLPLEVAGISKSKAEQRARDLLRLVGLEEFEGVFPRALSGGMAQRVALARALVGEPDGSNIVSGEIRGSKEDAERLGSELADELLGKGARGILDRLYKDQQHPPNDKR